jgi:hypothetical protein
MTESILRVSKKGRRRKADEGRQTKEGGRDGRKKGREVRKEGRCRQEGTK